MVLAYTIQSIHSIVFFHTLDVQQLKWCMNNVRSLLNKPCDFHQFLDITQPDGVELTECWLDSSIPISLLACGQTYHIFRKDRASRSGGICLLIKKSLHTHVTLVATPEPYSALEIVAVDLSDSTGVMSLSVSVEYSPHTHTLC